MTNLDIAAEVPMRHSVQAVDQQRELPSRVTTILHAVAWQHGVTLWDITGKSRVPTIARARFEAAERLRGMRWLGGRPSLPLIGQWLNRDHTTVINMLRRRAALNPPQSDAARIFQTGSML